MSRTDARTSLLSDASGAVADLGVMIPIVAALVLKNGLDPATVLVGAGALYIAAGAYFRVPVPVQPIKAAAAIAIARDLPPETIAAAGICLGALLAVIGLTRGANLIARAFATPVVRGLQLGVGLILVRAAFNLTNGRGSAVIVIAVAIAATLVLLSQRETHLPVALMLVAGGVVYSLVATADALPLRFSAWDPSFLGRAFEPSVLWSAFTLLVIPQVPLTFGNAIVAVTDVERRYFGDKSARITPASISLSCGMANLAACALGGMPMCHGSGGLTAHYRAGARTFRMNFIIGGALLALGLGFGATALGILSLIPLAVLMGFLMFTGVMHGALVLGLRGTELAIAVAMGVVGVLTSNLALALLLGLLTYWPSRLARRVPKPA